MRGDPTTGPTDAPTAALAVRLRAALRPRALTLLCAAGLFGMLLAALAYQIPAMHVVDIGRYDAAYLQGWLDPEQIDAPNPAAYLTGSDGAARWTGAESYVLFPQAGQPAHVTLRVRGRPGDTATPLTLLVNGTIVARRAVSPDWQIYTIPITGGWLKPEDVLLTLRSEPAPLGPSDSRRVGVLADQVTYATDRWPILPYPSQLLYAAAAAGMLWLLLAGAQRRWYFFAAVIGVTLAFELLYRLQPIYPWPIRGLLPGICLGLAALLLLRHAADLRMIRWLPDLIAAGGIGVWVAVVLLLARDHLVLSVPGVEKDFRVFATRVSLDQVFHADGFYNLGYPLLIWLVRPLAEQSAFLAGRIIAACAGGLLLLATWRIARRRFGLAWGLGALAIVACSPLVVQYSLYLGSDMPFAALCALALDRLDAALASEPNPPALRWRLASAGLFAGSAFLIRHPGLALLPLGWLAIISMAMGTMAQPHGVPRWRSVAAQVGLFSLACLVAMAPQLFVNLRDTGQLFYSQQTKNIWLAVFGDGDWGRWGEAANTIGLTEIVLQDPARFWANLSGNLRAFIGTGAEDTSEFGRAIQLRLLGFPANWLGVVGLLATLWQLPQSWRGAERARPQPPLLMALWVLFYTPVIAVGFVLPRFFLPLAMAYALAAGWALAWLGQRSQPKHALALALGLCVIMWGGFGAGATYVLRPAELGAELPGQPATTLAIAQQTLSLLGPGERILVRVPTEDEAGLALAKYSAISQRVVAPPPADTPAALRASGARLLIWSNRLGPLPPVGHELGRAGPYSIMRIDQ